MAKPSGTLSSEMVAVVSSLVAVMPALPSCAESAIVKQPACAAASSSSGLVPTPFSNRVLKEYCVCLSTPLSVEMVPLPSFKPPCHTADALRCITSLLLRFSQYSSQENSIPGLVGRVYSENAVVETRLCAVMTSVLKQIAHRPWPLPVGPWVMAQRWHDLLFAHWPVPAAELQHHIPTPLTIDTFNGQAWLAVVPFRMSGVRLRGTPAVPWLSAFPELNVRTYVKCEGRPGVWFFSLDAGNPLAVAIARAWFHLPYFRARMRCSNRDGWIEYDSQRARTGAFAARFIIRPGLCKRPKPSSCEIRWRKRLGFRSRRASRCCISRKGKTSSCGGPSACSDFQRCIVTFMKNEERGDNHGLVASHAPALETVSSDV